MEINDKKERMVRCERAIRSLVVRLAALTL